MNRRSVLVVAPWLPLPADFGGAIRTLELIKGLSCDNHVLLLAPARPDERTQVLALGDLCDVTAVPAAWTPRHPANVAKRVEQMRSLFGQRSFLERSARNLRMQAVLDRLFLTDRIDAVQFEFAQMGTMRLARPCPAVLNAHNIEHELLDRVASSSSSLFTRALKSREARKIRRMEQHVWRQADVCIATSHADAARIENVTRKHVPVVPNGVDCRSFAPPVDIHRQPLRVVFTGTMRHQPNVDAVRWYRDHVHPQVRRSLPAASFEVAGADPPSDIMSDDSLGIAVSGRVDDIRPHLHHASVAVVPLFAGGGTRFKILEAFAAGTPVVSTTIGAEGLEVFSGEHLLVADSAQEFAAAVQRLLTDDALATTLREQALAFVTSHYDWSVVVPKLLAAHELARERFEASGAPRI